MHLARRSLRAALLILGLLAGTALTLPQSAAFAEPLSQTRAEDLKPRIESVAGRAVVLTPGALYRFQPKAEAWMSLTSEDGLPTGSLLAMSLTDEDLWITGVGASVSDAKFDDWQRYEPGEGYPGRLIFDVESDEDYAYAGTDEGAARFDRYVLEWEPLEGPPGHPLGPIRDVAVGKDRVWFALDHGIAEYRKEAESFRVDSLLGQLRAPRVLALRQTGRYLWAITALGLARYDKEFETWISHIPGVDLPDARIHQAMLLGDDLWLGTDDGLWRYRSDSGIWRRDESCNQMPGKRVFSFSLQGGFWVVTEEAYAFYDKAASRWIDYTASVPIAPGQEIELAWSGAALLILGSQRIVHALPRQESNPSLFSYHEHAIIHYVAATVARPAWRPMLDDSGLGLRKSGDEYLLLKGGATLDVKDNDPGKQEGESDFENLIHDTRIDLTLSGKLHGGRTLSGMYDTTDPDNEAYLLSFRGTRTDVVRNVSAGEINQRCFNSDLVPDTGLKGAWARTELGRRSEATRRRLLTADGWVGERRTFPGRKVFYGREMIYDLDHWHLIPGSERIEIDHEILRVAIDYTIDWERGNFIIAEHILLDDDTAIEVTYLYEVEDGDSAADCLGVPGNRDVYAGQVGFAPDDHFFLGLNGSGWTDASERDAGLVDFNTRLEYKDGQSFLRLTPEIAFSHIEAEHDSSGGNGQAGESGRDAHDTATAIALRGRYRRCELSASHRSLGNEFVSMGDRRTLLGRLREESRLTARLDVGENFQTTLEWDQVLSDRVGALEDGAPSGADPALPGRGEESLLMGGVRFLRGGFPNISLRRGRVIIDSLGNEKEKQISRAELELSPDPSSLGRLRIKRLWLRAFFQRNDREQRPASAAVTRQITDHAFIRLNGSSGSPFSWNLSWEDRWIHRPEEDGPKGIRRSQDLDFTIQSQPHSSLDAFLNWESERDLRWLEQGGSESFEAQRRCSATALFYPGRILAPLRPLSFQVDLSGGGWEEGKTGEDLPGSSSLWETVPWASERRKNRFGAVESRLQILSWLRLIDHLERNKDEDIKANSSGELRTRLFENRIEIRPRGGLLTLRVVDEKKESESQADTLMTATECQTRRFTTEWNQTWGGGWLSYFSFELKRTQDYQPRPTHRWRPQIRGTYRQNRWRLDASLGVSYTYEEVYCKIADCTSEYRSHKRTLVLSWTLNIQPLRILTLKMQHTLDIPHQAPCKEKEQTNHGILLRVTIRA